MEVQARVDALRAWASRPRQRCTLDGEGVESKRDLAACSVEVHSLAMASNTELAPGFLVAAPSLLDPNFHRTVVLLVEHRPEGSLGFVVNRPSEMTHAELASAAGIDLGGNPASEGSVLVGGPVAPHTGWIVFDSPEDMPDAVKVNERVRVSASRTLLESILKGEGPPKKLLILGYAGWGPGQLDQELSQGSWLPVDLDEHVVFDTPHDERWEAALRSAGIDPARLTGGSMGES